MKRSLCYQSKFLTLLALAFAIAACESVKTPVTPEPDISVQPIADVKKAQPLVVASALPNLRIVGIQHTASVGSDGRCSIVFYCTVSNLGTAPARSFVVGMRGWGTQTIPTCT